MQKNDFNDGLCGIKWKIWFKIQIKSIGRTNAKQICITNFVSNLASIKITFILVLNFIWLIVRKYFGLKFYLMLLYVCVYIIRYHVLDHRKGDILQNRKKVENVENNFLSEM